MKINRKKLLSAAVTLVIVGAAVFGIGRAIHQDFNQEGSTTMDNQSYALEAINHIQINTDSPRVIVKSTSGDQINAAWEEDEYVTYDAQVAGGTLKIDYRVNANWLESLFSTMTGNRDYVLEIELPAGYAGGLTVQTASGSVTVDDAAALRECSLKSASGKIDAENITSQGNVEIRSTSGSISAVSVHAAGDLQIRTVSGSVEFARSSALGGVGVQTTSGSVDAEEISAVTGMTMKTTSGRIELSDAKCDAKAALESISGALHASGVACSGFTAKTTSGSIRFEGLTTDTVDLKSISGSVDGTVNGKRTDYGITVHTVSGSSNLASSEGGKAKALKVDTVSGSIRVQFTGE